LLGTYDGLVNQNNSDGKTIFGSIINEKSNQSWIPNIALNYYNDSTALSNRFIPFFIPTPSLTAEIFNRV